MKVWITKYALTKGVFEDVGYVRDSGVFVNMFNDCFVPGYWEYTKDDAIAKACRMRDAETAALRKQIAKLEAITFDV